MALVAGEASGNDQDDMARWRGMRSGGHAHILAAMRAFAAIDAAHAERELLKDGVTS